MASKGNKVMLAVHPETHRKAEALKEELGAPMGTVVEAALEHFRVKLDGKERLNAIGPAGRRLGRWRRGLPTDGGDEA